MPRAPVLASLLALGAVARAAEPTLHVRSNQAGYRPGDLKRVVLFSETRLEARFEVRDGTTRVVLRGPVPSPPGARWGRFAHHYEVSLDALRAPGRYALRVGRVEAGTVAVASDAYRSLAGDLLEFLRQQRCGYNPFLDVVCHAFDGRTAYGPLPAGSYVDARGGWHDAGDQLKYLLTTSNATAQLLLAHRLAPDLFPDAFDERGRPGGNGHPDVLDEARWGLEWMLRLHPSPGELYHQVADDRDHIGWKLPHEETSDYGWGKGSYRVVYFADGRPQGLGAYSSASTGVANLAGRYAAAMALAYRAWKDDPRERQFAERCRQAGIEVYALGRAREGVQQGNSYGSPYRYGEETWADDMEWGAAALFEATGEKRYLDDAVRYAGLIGATSAVGRDSAQHYQFYPFMNAGHFALFGLVDGPVYARVFESLKGVGLSGPDLFAAFQGEAVYHDDVKDYSSNEPTMDGTASAVLLAALMATGG